MITKDIKLNQLEENSTLKFQAAVKLSLCDKTKKSVVLLLLQLLYHAHVIFNAFYNKTLKNTSMYLLIVLTQVYAGSSSLTCKIVPLLFLLGLFRCQ